MAKSNKKNYNERLEQRLWRAADGLRSNSGLKASEYAQPVLGLIFLRFADAKFEKAGLNLVKEGRIDTGASTMDESFTKDYFQAEGVIYLPEKARYSYLLNLPSQENYGKAINKAMELIERENPDLLGALPKNYEKLGDSIVLSLLKNFSEIPVDAEGDMFGKIYEYFLGKFARTEGQKGGEFFTPTSIVKLIVEIIEPFKGRVLDPACGSGGMFVQSANFINQHKKNGDTPDKNIAIYGQEKTLETVYLCKMNLAVHGLSGDIKQANTMYDDVHDSVNKFDFIMANPPFNLKGVDKERLKNDERYSLGIPNADNANYLWIQIFYNCLNSKGRAGFVMASGTEGSGNKAEVEIRKKIIQNQDVDVIVAVGNKFFYTVSVPCTLWFLDKEKKNTERKDKILFIDTRKIFREIDKAHREFTPEQIQYISNIVRLYRGEKIDSFTKYLDDQLLVLKKTDPASNDEEKEINDRIGIINELKTNWEKNFKDNNYADAPGLCKIKNIEEIEANDWVLNPGRYVGSDYVMEDDEIFEEKMKNLTKELSEQFGQSQELEDQIKENLKKIGFKI